jgi:DNA-binding transcriptional MerR regulator
MGLVVPEKIGEGKKPVVLYNENQIEQLRLINTATAFLSLDGIRLALKKKRLSEVVKALVEILN